MLGLTLTAIPIISSLCIGGSVHISYTDKYLMCANIMLSTRNTQGTEADSSILVESWQVEVEEGWNKIHKSS